eukprot:SAG22_NODE_2028_length_3118_cov_1.428619_3_plen_52_part_00
MAQAATLHVVSHAGHETARHAPDECFLAMHKFMKHGARSYKMKASVVVAKL